MFRNRNRLSAGVKLLSNWENERKVEIGSNKMYQIEQKATIHEKHHGVFFYFLHKGKKVTRRKKLLIFNDCVKQSLQ